MKELFIIFFLLFICFQATNSQTKFSFSAGYKNDGLNKVGPNGDEFSNGNGISLETASNTNSGISIGIFSVDYYKNKNILKGSEITCSYLTFYYFPLDWKFPLYYSKLHKLKIYLGASIGNQLMYVEKTKGVDYSWLLSGSFGIQYALSTNIFIQLQARPYLTFFNQLRPAETNLSNGNGMEFKFSLGVL